MATKRERQAKIAEILRRYRVRSQLQLQRRLRDFGLSVAQATLSRDLRELGVVRGPNGYEQLAKANSLKASDLRRILREFVRSISASGNIVVIKTDPGNAHTVAVNIDRASWSEILGTVAGDDTIFAVLKRPSLKRRVLERIRSLLKS